MKFLQIVFVGMLVSPLAFGADWNTSLGLATFSTGESMWFVDPKPDQLSPAQIFFQTSNSSPVLFWQSEASSRLREVRFSPDGNWVSFLELGSWENGMLSTQRRQPGQFKSPAADFPKARVLRVLSRTSVEQLFEMSRVGKYAWSPDSAYIAYTQGDVVKEGHGPIRNEVTIIRDLETGLEETVFNGGKALFWEASDALLIEDRDGEGVRIAKDSSGVWVEVPGEKGACPSPAGRYYLRPAGLGGECQIWSSEDPSRVLWKLKMA